MKCYSVSDTGTLGIKFRELLSGAKNFRLLVQKVLGSTPDRSTRFFFAEYAFVTY